MIRPRLSFQHKHMALTSAPKLPVMEWLEKAKPKRRVHGGVGGFTGIKLSNVGDSYLWNTTSDICRMGLVWIWLLTTNKVCSSHNVLSVRVFFIQSRRIDHKHGKMLSDHRDAGLEQIWPRTADENLPTSLLIFCNLVKKRPWIIS